jgi:hypothetical protein
MGKGSRLLVDISGTHRIGEYMRIRQSFCSVCATDPIAVTILEAEAIKACIRGRDTANR